MTVDPDFSLSARSALPDFGETILRELIEFASGVCADGITIWVASEGYLTAVWNPLEADLPGARQPLGSGLVSKVHVTGLAIFENDLALNPSHDGTIDKQLGRTCRAMMAAPFEGAGASGVVSVVWFDPPAELPVEELHALKQLTRMARRVGESLGMVS